MMLMMIDSYYTISASRIRIRFLIYINFLTAEPQFDFQPYEALWPITVSNKLRGPRFDVGQLNRDYRVRSYMKNGPNCPEVPEID